MTTPRAILIDSEQAFAYHLISRCVRRSFLCGKDPITRKDYSHRKTWLIERMQHLEKAFALEIYAYAIMSNHLHLVVYYDPLAAQSWSENEVAQRWCHACPPRNRDGSIDETRRENVIDALLNNPDRLARARAALGSVSVFMQLLKQPIARRANQEDRCTGHFFEQRFYSGVLLDENAMIDAMRYVDLNPVRAKLAKHIADIKDCSITKRLAALRNTRKKIESAIEPVFDDTPQEQSNDTAITLSTTVDDYIQQLEETIRWERLPKRERLRDPPNLRIERMAVMRHRQRAYGPAHLLSAWIEQRGLQLRELATPSP